MTEPSSATVPDPIPPLPVEESPAVVTASPAPAKPGERLVSVDALRGFDMFWIMGADQLARSLCEWRGTLESLRLGEQFEHVSWEGFHFYDLIFPLFIFVVGVVVPFSLNKYRAGTELTLPVFGRIARRVAFLFFLGLLYNGLLRFEGMSELRVMGVLQRIAICYGAASILYLLLGIRGRAIVFASILLGYWALFALVPSPLSHMKGDYGRETSLASWVDLNYLPGRPYTKFGDNEGLLSGIPAIATALLGVFAGEWLRSGRSGWNKAGGLLAAGLACLGLGYAWSYSFPIIKILWSSSYVLVVGGWSLILLAIFYAVIDVMKFRAWAFPFVVIGMNAITIYFLPRLVDFERVSKFFLGGLANLCGPVTEKGPSPAGIALLVAGTLLTKWLLLLYLYRKRIFLRV